MEKMPKSQNTSSKKNEQPPKVGTPSKADTLNKISAKGEGTALNISKISFSTIKELLTVIKDSLFMDKLKTNLGWLSFAGAVLSFPFNTYKAIHAAFLSKDDKATRGMQTLMNVSGMALGVLGAIGATGLAVIASPILIVTNAAKSTFENLWGIGKSFYNRHFSKEGKALKNEIKYLKDALKVYLKKNDNELTQQDKIIMQSFLEKLTKAINKQHESNTDIANKSHALMQSALALIGAGLLFNPITLPIGIGILLSTSTYGVVDASGDFVNLVGKLLDKKIDVTFNPFKLASKLIDKISGQLGGEPALNKAFTPLTPQNLKIELEKQVMKETGVDLPQVETKVQTVPLQAEKETASLTSNTDTSEKKAHIAPTKTKKTLTDLPELTPEEENQIGSTANLMQMMSKSSSSDLNNNNAPRETIKSTSAPLSMQPKAKTENKKVVLHEDTSTNDKVPETFSPSS